MISYGHTLAIRRELIEVRRSLGAAAYQIGEELAVCPFPKIV